MIYLTKSSYEFFIKVCIIFMSFDYFGVVAQVTSLPPPKIIGSQEGFIEINTGEKLTVTCEGSSEVYWCTNDPDDPNLYRKEGTTPNTTELIFKNPVYTDTGYYACSYDCDDEENELVEVQVYVYVYDNEHLFLPAPDTDVINVNATSKDVTIPCRPTSPKVSIELQLNNSRVSYKMSPDPSKGIIVNVNESFKRGQHVFVCLFSMNSTQELQQQTHIIKYNPKLSDLPKPKFVARPVIVDESEAHYIGLQLHLSCKIHKTSVVSLAWHLPVKQNDSRLNILDEITQRVIWKVRTILLSNLSIEDSGTYVCSVMDNAGNKNNTSINIMVHDEPYINLKTESDTIVPINLTVGDKIYFEVHVDAYPTVKQEWFVNNKTVTTNSHYNITSSPKLGTLLVQKAKITDSGQYMFQTTNKGGRKTISFTLNIPEKPNVSLDGKSYILLNKKNQFSCTAVGNPIPEIRWSFKKCFSNDNCSNRTISNVKQEIDENLLSVTSHLTLNKTVSGTLYCEGQNNVGKDFNLKEVVITDVHDGDVEDGFNVWQSIEPASVGDSIVLYCGSSKHNFTGPLVWYLNDSETPITSNANFEMVNITTLYSHQWNILIKNLTKEYNGKYRCDEGSRSTTLILNVVEPKHPEIYDSNLKGLETKINQGIDLRFYCRARGIPTPVITWKKNNAPWIPDPKRIKIDNSNETVLFNSTIKEDEGNYSCEVSNRLNTQIRSSMLVINDLKNVTTKKLPTWVIILTIMLIIFLIILITLVFIKIRNEKRRIAEFENAGLDHFDEGNVECINPDLAIDDQADLLPYYNEWEFPREKLKMGIVLGAGAFGVVMKAEAHGILDGEDCTTVAVKMVKKNVEITYIKALASELKIMGHLGYHVNIANLLGACTKRLVSKRELCVIVEYCKHGNLQNYLQRHRRDFVNQIDPSTGDINTAIRADITARSESMGAKCSSFFRRTNSNISNTSKPIKTGGADYRAELQKPNLRNSNDNIKGTAISLIPDEDDVIILSNDSSTQQPEWRSNYQSDYSGNVAPLCSQDLLCYAFQVATGMNYLVSRHVLHGDLAARNILLADNNVVKICDFGLAKSMYKDANYIQKKDSPLPIKWMALESIRDRIFSVQSDVWSYGIVLWEFFSLGQTPYPGMKVDETFYHKLEDGYRLSKPEFATKELYQLMLQCWEARPKGRPSFEKLADDIGTMLENAVREHYINLNSPYLIMNNMKNKNHSDYLSMMKPPNFDNLTSSTDNINEIPTTIPLTPTIIQNNPSTPNTEYLCMSSKPTKSNFDSIHKSQQDLTPSEMLSFNNEQRNSDIESDTGLTSPDFQNYNIKSFFNPGYQKTAKLMSASPSVSDIKTNDVVTTEIYINMPGQKNSDDIVRKSRISTDLDNNLDDPNQQSTNL